MSFDPAIQNIRTSDARPSRTGTAGGLDAIRRALEGPVTQFALDLAGRKEAQGLDEAEDAVILLDEEEILETQGNVRSNPAAIAMSPHARKLFGAGVHSRAGSIRGRELKERIFADLDLLSRTEEVDAVILRERDSVIAESEEGFEAEAVRAFDEAVSVLQAKSAEAQIKRTQFEAEQTAAKVVDHELDNAVANFGAADTEEEQLAFLRVAVDNIHDFFDASGTLGMERKMLEGNIANGMILWVLENGQDADLLEKVLAEDGERIFTDPTLETAIKNASSTARSRSLLDERETRLQRDDKRKEAERAHTDFTARKEFNGLAMTEDEWDMLLELSAPMTEIYKKLKQDQLQTDSNIFLDAREREELIEIAETAVDIEESIVMFRDRMNSKGNPLPAKFAGEMMGVLRDRRGSLLFSPNGVISDLERRLALELGSGDLSLDEFTVERHLAAFRQRITAADKVEGFKLGSNINLLQEVGDKEFAAVIQQATNDQADTKKKNATPPAIGQLSNDKLAERGLASQELVKEALKARGIATERPVDMRAADAFYDEATTIARDIDRELLRRAEAEFRRLKGNFPEGTGYMDRLRWGYTVHVTDPEIRAEAKVARAKRDEILERLAGGPSESLSDKLTNFIVTGR